MPDISLLIPSRGRPGHIEKLVESVRAASTLDIEVVVRIDADEPQRVEYERICSCHLSPVTCHLFSGPRLVMSDLWNDAAKHATADVMMLCGDDLLWRTSGWDVMVKNAFDAHPDKIVLVYGGDGHHASGFATHPLIHRRWYETLGYFTAPYFSSDYADAWLWEISGMIGRRQYLPFVTEHMHYSFGKAKIDQTMQENIDRRARDNPAALFASKAAERRRDAEKLLSVISNLKSQIPSGPALEVVCAYRSAESIGNDFAPKLSILIPCLEKRERSRSLLIDSLRIQPAYVNGSVEILTLTDSGQMSVGAKRNALLAAARGDYVCFCDDDDRLFGDYLPLIFEALTPDTGNLAPDCVCLTTLVTFDDGVKPPRLDRLSFEPTVNLPSTVYRMLDCGLHLCPLRRSIALKVPFEDVSWGEDVNWSRAVKPLVKTWNTIRKPVYHYDFSTVHTDTQRPGMVNHARWQQPVLRPGRMQTVAQRPQPRHAPSRASLVNTAWNSGQAGRSRLVRETEGRDIG